MPVEWCVAVCSVGSGQPLREGLKGPRMPAKQTKQPSVSGAESKSVRGCRGFSVSWVQVGSLCENRRGQKETVRVRMKSCRVQGNTGRRDEGVSDRSYLYSATSNCKA